MNDLTEAIAGTATGLLVSWCLTMWALPAWGYAPSPAAAGGITAMYTAASFARQWAVRAAFRTWQERGM